MNFANVKEWKIPYNGSLVDVLQVKDSNNTRVIWEKPTPGPDYTEPFYVENITNNTETLRIPCSGPDSTLTIEYSLDKTNWSVLGNTSYGTPLTYVLNPNTKLYLRCNTEEFANNHISGVSKIGGNILSLLYGNSFTGYERVFPQKTTLYPGYQFSGTFIDNTNLISADSLLLPALTLDIRCYYEMFTRCTSLISAPSIPATTLAEDCYRSMFYECTSLTSAPSLPATTLSGACYNEMFYGCSSLTSAPALPATTLAEDCYGWMFAYCSSLTTAPDLLVSVLPDYAYEYMFYECHNLNYVKCLATDISSRFPTIYWLYNVSSSGTFVKDPLITSWSRDEHGIPSGWTVVDAQ